MSLWIVIITVIIIALLFEYYNWSSIEVHNYVSPLCMRVRLMVLQKYTTPIMFTILWTNRCWPLTISHNATGGRDAILHCEVWTTSVLRGRISFSKDRDRTTDSPDTRWTLGRRWSRLLLRCAGRRRRPSRQSEEDSVRRDDGRVEQWRSRAPALSLWILGVRLWPRGRCRINPATMTTTAPPRICSVSKPLRLSAAIRDLMLLRFFGESFVNLWCTTLFISGLNRRLPCWVFRC